MATAHSTGDEPPTRGAAPSLGLVLAGVALVAGALPWTGQPQLLAVAPVAGSLLGAVLAGLAALAFSLRRFDVLDRVVAAPVAGTASVGVTLLALYRLLTPALGEGTAPTVGVGLPIAALAGLFAAGTAVADWRRVTDEQLWTKIKAVGAAIGIGFLAFLTSTVVATLPAFAVRQFGRTVAVAVLTVGSGLGLLLFAAVYLRTRDLEWDYIDVDWPDLAAVGYGIGGLVVLYLSAVVVNVAFMELGLPTASSSIEELAREMERPVFLLALVPLSWLVIGPGEELVYRNVVQKYLYESFSRPTAVVVASVAFAAVHFQQYADPNPIAMLSTLSVVFVLSLVLGYTYYKTENLVVPIFIHGTFNAIQFFALYAQLTGMVPAQ